MCTSMISLSKIAHQMWRDHPFCQGNRTTGGGGWRQKGRGLDKILKKRGGGQYRGGLHKMGGGIPFCQLCIKNNLHINITGLTILAKNVISGIRNFWNKGSKKVVVYELNEAVNSSRTTINEKNSNYMKFDPNCINIDLFHHSFPKHPFSTPEK